MNYGDILPECKKGVQHFDEINLKQINKRYPRGIIEGEPALLWACIGEYCKDYVECYSKAYLEQVKQ
jgi:hypothetical protein